METLILDHFRHPSGSTILILRLNGEAQELEGLPERQTAPRLEAHSPQGARQILEVQSWRWQATPGSSQPGFAWNLAVMTSAQLDWGEQTLDLQWPARADQE